LLREAAERRVAAEMKAERLRREEEIEMKKRVDEEVATGEHHSLVLVLCDLFQKRRLHVFCFLSAILSFLIYPFLIYFLFL
jgi:hypothetical protein